jgi:hypothetical protein
MQNVEERIHVGDLGVYNANNIKINIKALGYKYMNWTNLVQHISYFVLRRSWVQISALTLAMLTEVSLVSFSPSSQMPG